MSQYCSHYIKHIISVDSAICLKHYSYANKIIKKTNSRVSKLASKSGQLGAPDRDLLNYYFCTFLVANLEQ